VGTGCSCAAETKLHSKNKGCDFSIAAFVFGVKRRAERIASCGRPDPKGGAQRKVMNGEL